MRVRRVVTPEGLGGWPVPTDAQIRRLQDLVAHPARLRYFFSRLENPLWLERLADDGWYDPERVPEPIAEADGTARIDFWPLSEYLRRVGGDVPGTAASVVESLAGTTNPIVQRDLVATLLRLPVGSAEGFIDDVIGWIHGPYSRSLDERDLGNLAARLLDGGQERAGRRLASAILSWLQEEYWLREAIGVLADPLARSGIDGVLVLADALDRAIGEKAGAEAASFMRASIADHEQDQHIDAADHLTNGLRDCALAYLRRTGDPAVLEALLRRRAVLFSRIAYYVTAAAISDPGGEEYPDAVSRITALYGYARSMILDKSAFNDPRTRLEHGALIRAMLSHLAAEDIAQLADWLRRGPQMSDTEISQMLGSPGAPAPAEQVARFRDHWRADRTALLGQDLPQPLHAIAADLAARGVQPPEHPGFSHWTSTAQVIESPVSGQELSSMTVAEVTDLARNYQPPTHMVFRFLDQSLAQQIAGDITARPSEYSLLASGFADLRPAYLNAFLEGLRQAIGTRRKNATADRPENPLDLDWEAVLDLVASIAGIRDPGGRNAEQAEESPRWVHRSVLMLLKTALATESSGLSARHAEAILTIIQTLLDSPDPVPEDETAEDRLDPADRALNSVRGQAVGCLIAFSSWWRGLGSSEDEAPPVLLELLSRELDLAHETSTAIRTVYGQFFPLLYSSLPAWTGEHLEAIFGPLAATPDSTRLVAEPSEQIPAEVVGQAAFDAYLLANGPQDRSFLELLKPYYEREINRLRKQPPRAWRSTLRNTRQAVLDHLFLFLLWNALSTDDPLITTAIRKAGVQDAGEAIGHLGWLIFRAGEAAANQAQAAQDVWSWWREQAQRRAGNGDRDSAVAMVTSFPWWWRAGNLDTAWQFRELLLALKISPAIETPGLVAQTLADRVIGNEDNVITALDIILDNTTDIQLQHAVMKAQPALRHLLSATDPEIRRRTTVLVQKIAAWGMIELAKQITTTPDR